MCTFECSNKLRHNGIDAMYVGVKLLNKYDGTPRGIFQVEIPNLESE